MKTFINQNFLLRFVIALGLALTLFGGLQYAARVVFADPDGFYHAKASQLLFQGKLHDTFPWLYYTTWNRNYADQHYLYHWLLVPFNSVEKLPISVVVFSLIFVALFLLTLHRYRAQYQIVWTVLLLGGSADFLFRVNLVKANTLSLALLCIIAILVYGYHFSQNNKTRVWNLIGIGLTSGIFVWTYGGFVCVPFLLATYFLAKLLTEFVNKDWKQIDFFQSILPFLVSLIGIVTGMVFHPHHDHIFSLIYDQFFLTGLGAGRVVPAGNEWKPFDLVWFVQSNALILTVWFFSIASILDKLWKDFKKTLSESKMVLIIWLQLTTIGLMVLTLWHRRFVEYWVPLAVLAAAITLQPYLVKLSFSKLKEVLVHWQFKFALLLLFSVTVSAIVYNIHYVATALINSDSSNTFQASSKWLSDNSQPGDIVFNTQWDQFPQMFYWNDKDYYVVGLDPTFMYIENSELYWRWRKIADDKPDDWRSVDQIYEILTNEFHTKYLFLDRSQNSKLIEYINNQDPSHHKFSLIYEDDYSKIIALTKGQ